MNDVTIWVDSPSDIEITVDAPGTHVIDVTAPPTIEIDVTSSGLPGPTAVSTDPDNAAVLGSDSLIFVPETSSDPTKVSKAGDTMTGPLFITPVNPTDPDIRGEIEGHPNGGLSIVSRDLDGVRDLAIAVVPRSVGFWQPFSTLEGYKAYNGLGGAEVFEVPKDGIPTQQRHAVTKGYVDGGTNPRTSWRNGSNAFRANNPSFVKAADEVGYYWRTEYGVTEFYLRFKVIGTPVASSVSDMNLNDTGYPWVALESIIPGMMDTGAVLKNITGWVFPFTWFGVRLEDPATGVLGPIPLAANTVLYFSGRALSSNLPAPASFEDEG